ncbi:thiamine-phosphate kinase [Litorimonas sp. RW-G-Af-16]|uniref:thiamine-phosphate kinase n=1 Tax=Litorimonas sp. RW-G-Af-16 TaxID=3241168 RepID=UPI00390CACFE
MDEFDFIDLLRPLVGPTGLGLQDDAAKLSVPDGQDLIISTDTMVEGVHFPLGRRGGGFSERLLRTALSDLAAKGARPIGYMLSVAWPVGTDAKWMAGFVKGLDETQSAFDCPIMGGDTTSTTGPLIASATVYGLVPTGEMVTRAGAKVGDDVWFTGVLGRAEKGLALMQGKVLDLPETEILACEDAYLRPEPRFLFRKILRQYASACADISDGLISEAGHIAKASGVRLDLDAQHVDGTSFGDDYELLFTASQTSRTALKSTAEALPLKITRCGTVAEGEGVWVNGERLMSQGYKHTF